MRKVLELTLADEPSISGLYEDALVATHNPVAQPDLPWDAEEFDDVYSHFMLNQVSWRNVKVALAEWVRVLKGGGIMHVVVPSQRWLAAQLLQENVPLHTRALLFGNQGSEGQVFRNCFNVGDLRVFFADAGLQVIKARTGDIDLKVGDELVHGEQIYIAGVKRE